MTDPRPATIPISVVIISKRERSLEATLAQVTAAADHAAEVVVVDASDGELDDIRRSFPTVRWIDFVAPPGVRVSIPHQRNAGVEAASGDVIVFVDAGCDPAPAWLSELTGPILDGSEDVTAGPADVSGSVYSSQNASASPYVEECPTINMAFRRSAFTAVGGFDEQFEYGSDIDFSWRLRDAGYRIRWVASAAVSHDWGGRRRQAKRSYAYGRARARLYRKHRHRWRQILRSDPQAAVYPAFLLLLPVTVAFPWYPLLLAVPYYRARRSASPGGVVADHLLYGAGLLVELARLRSGRS